jgi:uncharacterized protein (TIGR02145 family)
MKKLFTLFAFLATIAINAQAPQGFNYQATVRNSTGALIVNQNVYFKFNVMLNSATSIPVFSETHYVPTDELGQVNLVIGQGTSTTGSFSTINWGTGNYYLGIELNTGTGYVAMGTTQLLSVPYALYANTAGNGQVNTPSLANVLAVNNDANNLQIKNLADPTDAQDAATKGYFDIQLQAQVSQLQAQISALQNAIVAPLPSITIGTQIWSSTNLDVTTYRDGTPIPQVTDPTQWANLTTGAWCYYNNDPANGTIYGKLYNWYAVAGIHDTDPSTPNKILAPQGWHIPTDAEWSILINHLDPNADGGNNYTNFAGGKMKSTGTIQASNGLWQTPNTLATNESGFTGLPAGYRFISTSAPFETLGTYSFWWSLSGEGADIADVWYRGLYYGSGLASRGSLNKRHGFSVRCLRD